MYGAKIMELNTFNDLQIRVLFTFRINNKNEKRHTDMITLRYLNCMHFM